MSLNPIRWSFSSMEIGRKQTLMRNLIKTEVLVGEEKMFVLSVLMETMLIIVQKSTEGGGWEESDLPSTNMRTNP